MKRRDFIPLLWLLMVSQSTSAWAQEDHVVTAQTSSSSRADACTSSVGKAYNLCIMGSLKKLTAACSKPGRVCAFPKRHRHFIFEGDYACIRLRQAMHRANSARKAAASRFRLMAAAVR